MKLTALLAQERREGIEQGREEGVKQGEERFAVKMTIKMLKEGNSMEKIAKFLELPLQKVREIAQQNNLIWTSFILLLFDEKKESPQAAY